MKRQPLGPIPAIAIGFAFTIVSAVLLILADNQSVYDDDIAMTYGLLAALVALLGSILFFAGIVALGVSMGLRHHEWLQHKTQTPPVKRFSLGG